MSNCKGLSEIECNKSKQCLYTNGKRRYCRTKKNKKLKKKTNKMNKSKKMTSPKPPTPPPSIQHNDLYSTISFKSMSKDKPIAGFDLDWTIIKTRSGKVFPKNHEDWDWLYDNTKEKLQTLSQKYNIVIITNQNGLKTTDKRDEFIKKALAIIKELNIPIKLYILIKSGFYRKPLTGIWEECNKEFGKSDKDFYCGDAAGRENDFAATDLMFAFNNKVHFYLPENLFLGEDNKVNVEFPTYLTDYLGKREELNIDIKEPTLILIAGYPGSGKSITSKQLNLPIASNDIQGSMAKCKKEVKKHLENKQSCIVDNTNLSKKDRNIYLDLAKQKKFKTMIIWINNNIHFCYYMNQLRCQLSKGAEHIVPKVAYYRLRKNFVKPQASECDYFIETQNKVEKYNFLFPDL